jgi:hypothetical protein
MNSTVRGTPQIPLTTLMADTIATHGLTWSMTYYAKRIPLRELRVLMRSAYLAAPLALAACGGSGTGDPQPERTGLPVSCVSCSH